LVQAKRKWRCGATEAAFDPERDIDPSNLVPAAEADALGSGKTTKNVRVSASKGNLSRFER
jgi:hypothetical protein